MIIYLTTPGILASAKEADIAAINLSVTVINSDLSVFTYLSSDGWSTLYGTLSSEESVSDGIKRLCSEVGIEANTICELGTCTDTSDARGTVRYLNAAVILSESVKPQPKVEYTWMPYAKLSLFKGTQYALSYLKHLKATVDTTFIRSFLVEDADTQPIPSVFSALQKPVASDALSIASSEPRVPDVDDMDLDDNPSECGFMAL